MDKSDELLVEALKESMAHGRYEVGTPEAQAAAEATDAEKTIRPQAFRAAGDSGTGMDMEAELAGDFFAALNAYRAIRDSGTKEEIAAAERHLQEVTREDLRRRESCGE